jgi:hypothetical protein
MFSLLRQILKYKNNLIRNFFKSKIKKELNYYYTVYYDKNKSFELSQLCSYYKTNKGYVIENKKDSNFKNLPTNLCHGYSDFYQDIFHLSRNYVKKVFELGIGSVDYGQIYNMNPLGKNYRLGGSLRMWRDYFNNAHIFGADIDKKCLFKEERIDTFFVDQSNKESILLMWKSIAENNFDIIIDDGCHRFDETIIFFENSIDKISNNGVYIIEDILLSQRKKFLNFFKNTNYNFKFIDFYRPKGKILNDTLLMITKY